MNLKRLLRTQENLLKIMAVQSLSSNIAHSSSKKSEDTFEETHTWKKGSTLLMGDSISLPNTRRQVMQQRHYFDILFDVF